MQNYDSVMFSFKGVDNRVKDQLSVMNELREETKGFCSTTMRFLLCFAFIVHCIR